MLKFYFPLFYLFNSRLKSKMHKISWFLIYVLPIYFIGLNQYNYDLTSYSIVFFISVLVFNSIYETGYLENDIQTTKKELNPTMRISENEYNFCNRNYYKLIFTKYISSFLLILFIYILYMEYLQVIQFIVFLSLLRLSFYIHNKIRSNLNILTFFLLSSLKYIIPLTVLLSVDQLLNISYYLFLFPFLRTIEHSTKVKYKLEKWAKIIGNHDLFRVKYYVVLVFISFLSLYFEVFDIYFILFSIYFLFYRISTFLIVKKKAFKRTHTGQSENSINNGELT